MYAKVEDKVVGKLKLASDATADFTFKGTAEIVTTVAGEKCNVTLSDTLHVPDLRTNLLSVSKITDRGYKVTFEKGEAVVDDRDGEAKLIAKRRNSLYHVDCVLSASDE